MNDVLTLRVRKNGREEAIRPLISHPLGDDTTVVVFGKLTDDYQEIGLCLQADPFVTSVMFFHPSTGRQSLPEFVGSIAGGAVFIRRSLFEEYIWPMRSGWAVFAAFTLLKGENTSLRAFWVTVADAPDLQGVVTQDAAD